MRRIGDAFSIEIPDDWAQSVEEGQLVAHGPGEEELTLAGSTVEAGVGHPAAVVGTAFNAAIAML